MSECKQCEEKQARIDELEEWADNVIKVYNKVEGCNKCCPCPCHKTCPHEDDCVNIKPSYPEKP